MTHRLDRQIFTIVYMAVEPALGAKHQPTGMEAEYADIRALAAAVRAARKRHALTQADLAGLSGVSLGFLIALEGGKPTVALNKVLQVLAALGLRLSVSDVSP